MTTMHISVPDDVRDKVSEVANRIHVSVDELATMALIEKVSVMLKDPFLEERAKKGDWKKFQEALDMIPDVPPEDYDKLE